MTEPLENAWVNSPIEQGDVIIFHSMAVHKGLANRGNRLRLSIDGRYQRVIDPITADSLKPALLQSPDTDDFVYVLMPLRVT